MDGNDGELREPQDNPILSGGLGGVSGVQLVERGIKEGWNFPDIARKQLPSELYLLFQNRLPNPPQRKDREGNVLPTEWSERARMAAVKTLVTIYGQIQRQEPVRHEHEHKHAHLHFQAEERRSRLAAIRADLGIEGVVESAPSGNGQSGNGSARPKDGRNGSNGSQ